MREGLRGPRGARRRRPAALSALKPRRRRRPGTPCRSRSTSSATRRSSAVVTLKFSAGAGTTATVPPSFLHQRRVIRGGADDRVALSQRPLEHLAPERLRRLHRPQPRAVERSLDAAVHAFLDRVGHRGRGDRRVRVAQRIEAGLDQSGTDQRARGIVHDDIRARPAPRPAPRAPSASAARRRRRRPSRPAPQRRAAAPRRSARSPSARAARRSTIRPSGAPPT